MSYVGCECAILRLILTSSSLCLYVNSQQCALAPDVVCLELVESVELKCQPTLEQAEKKEPLTVSGAFST